MRPPVTYPDVVTLALDYLRVKVPGVTMGNAIPTARPTPFVQVRRAGGLEQSVVTEQPRVDVQVWHATEHQAYALAAQVRAHLLAAAGRVTGVLRADDFTGPVPIPDEKTASARYLLTVTWTVRGAAL